MSKIFDALNQKSGQLPDLVLSALGDHLDDNTGRPAPETPIRLVETVALARISPLRMIPLRIPVNSPLFPFEGEHWSAGEQYRLARTKILQHAAQPHSIVVSSASPADGKTLTAINLAAALALRGETSVLLVDADLRRSAVHSRLDLPASPGLTEVLNGTATPEQAIIGAKQLPGLFVLAAGAPVKNPTELLGSSRWRALTKELSAAFKYVLFDTPPMGVIADFELVQSVCDGVLLVVRPDHTPRKPFFRALEGIPKQKRIGVVLNSIPEWFLTPEYRHGGYSGDYYATRG